MKNKITIVLPTIKYTKELDKAIASCFEIESIDVYLHVNINSTSTEFSNSIFWQDSRVHWHYTDRYYDTQRESINNAINVAKGEWLFILSDDDFILKEFFKGINFDDFSKSTLYATRINIIDENDNITSINEPYLKQKYTKDESLNQLFNDKIHHHLSLFVFHRSMYEKCGPLCFTGYPNGYYLDTIFHSKLIANCDFIYNAEDIVFSRRESSNQGSAKFYFGKEVNGYFDIIVDQLFQDENFKKEALKRYKTKESFYKKMIQGRFYIEWSKLNKPIYNKSFKKKIEFLYKHVMYWNTGFKFKVLSFLYVLFFPLKTYLPNNLKHYIKKVIGK